MNKCRNHQSIRLMKSKKRKKKFILFILFLMKKFLTKSITYTSQKQYSKTIFPKKSWKKTQKYLPNIFIKTFFLYCNLDVPIWFKTWKYPQHLKRNQNIRKIGADQLLFYQMYLRYMKDIFKTKCRLSLTKCCLNISEGFERF